MPGSNVTQIVRVSTFIGIHFELRSTRIHHDFAGTIADEYGRAHFIHDLVRSSLTYKNKDPIVHPFVLAIDETSVKGQDALPTISTGRKAPARIATRGLFLRSRLILTPGQP